MCGISGIIRFDQKIFDCEINAMVQAQKHRGPNGSDIYIKDNIAIGHNRLSVIDLQTGTQPMSNEDSTIWITYNGEIYNFKELRQFLLSKGHIFKTKSDTECIIHGYEEWGNDCVTKLNGMFSFCIVDYQKRLLFLARDHIGIKPLHYRIGNNYFAFASEINALREITDAQPQGKLSSIEHYLKYQYVPSPYTIFNDIFKLPAASYLTVNFYGKIGTPLEYWKLLFKNDSCRLSKTEWLEKIDDTIEQVISKHLISDVEVGVLLSGGIDSSLVALHAKNLYKGKLKAFCIDFESKSYSELKYAVEAAKKIDIDLYFDTVRNDALNMVNDLVISYGEPFGDSSMIPTYYASKLARESVPVVLSGDGGDEAFGGYVSYINWLINKQLMHASKNCIKSIIKCKPSELFRNITYLSKFNKNSLAEWESFILYSSASTRKNLWKKDFVNMNCGISELFAHSAYESKKFDSLSFVQYMDYKTYLPCDILTKVDIASMRNGLEVRVPFVSLDIINLISNIPLELKYDKRSSQGKVILKKILTKYGFKNQFIEREKQGFAVPRVNWFLKDGIAYKLLKDLLEDNTSNLNLFFNVSYIENMMSRHSLNNDLSGILWLLLVFGIWSVNNKNIVF